MIDNYNYVDDLVSTRIVGDMTSSVDKDASTTLKTTDSLSTVELTPVTEPLVESDPAPTTDTLAPTASGTETDMATAQEPTQTAGTQNVINLTIDPISGTAHDMDTGEVIVPKETPLTLGGGGGFGGPMGDESGEGVRTEQRKSILPLILIAAGIAVLVIKKKKAK